MATRAAKPVKPRDLRRRLVTPEGVDLGVVIGDTGQRIGAFLLDMIVMLALMIVLSIAAGYAAASNKAGDEMVGVVWLLGFFLIRNFYFIAMELRPRAATLGKRWMKLRVVARDGGRLTADAVVARNLMREVETFLPLTMLITGLFAGTVDALTGWLGFIWTGVFLFFPFFNRDRLRVGDLLAGTWVICTTRDKLDRDLTTMPTVAGFVFTAEQLDAYGVYELETLEGVLRRSEAAAKLTVAQAIIDKIGWPTEVTDIDGFLTAYYTQLRVRLEKRLLLGKRRADKHDVGA
ncbi:RDD family protein [Sphingomonas sp. SUN039]|uniref:RDD family protein n=1 Tax=Sphingomonas sp. SUN039 TaxID=2937787 RepID=UPI002164D809|nr:RDD family protein [Sphingomonas sp. SUN039]UVO55688.1 RDD family protein [Sphingomonas sp. SUN039]